MSVCLIIVIIALVDCHVPVYYRLIVSRVFLAVTIHKNDMVHKLLFLLLHMRDLHNGIEEDTLR